jgi:hypothetical protein
MINDPERRKEVMRMKGRRYVGDDRDLIPAGTFH